MHTHPHENLITRIRTLSDDWRDDATQREFYAKLHIFIEDLERDMKMCQDYEERFEAETYLQDCAYEVDILSATSS